MDLLDCDCCLLGCLCGSCCAAAMDDDERRRREQYGYRTEAVYVQPVVVTTAAYPNQPTTAYATATPAPAGPYYYYQEPNTVNTGAYPPAAYPAAYPPQGTYPPQSKV